MKQRLSERIKLGPKDKVTSGITLSKMPELLVPFSLCAFSALETQVRVLILNIMYMNYSDSYMDSYEWIMRLNLVFERW
jgi:hypothetical protein